MEFKLCVEGRRSIRRYSEEKPSRELLESVIESAALAPSWKNSQTTRYIIVDEEAVKTRLAEECTLGFGKNCDNIKGAPAVILLCTVNGHSGFERDGSFTTTKGTHWQSFDAGIAAQTLCLAAHDAGLGTVIMGIYDEAKAIELIGVPEGQSISAVIAIGYAGESPSAKPRKAVSELLSYR